MVSVVGGDVVGGRPWLRGAVAAGVLHGGQTAGRLAAERSVLPNDQCCRTISAAERSVIWWVLPSVVDKCHIGAQLSTDGLPKRKSSPKIAISALNMRSNCIFDAKNAIIGVMIGRLPAFPPSRLRGSSSVTAARRLSCHWENVSMNARMPICKISVLCRFSDCGDSVECPWKRRRHGSGNAWSKLAIMALNSGDTNSASAWTVCRVTNWNGWLRGVVWVSQDDGAAELGNDAAPERAGRSMM